MYKFICIYYLMIFSYARLHAHCTSTITYVIPDIFTTTTFWTLVMLLTSIIVNCSCCISKIIFPSKSKILLQHSATSHIILILPRKELKAVVNLICITRGSTVQYSLIIYLQQIYKSANIFRIVNTLVTYHFFVYFKVLANKKQARRFLCKEVKQKAKQDIQQF